MKTMLVPVRKKRTTQSMEKTKDDKQSDRYGRFTALKQACDLSPSAAQPLLWLGLLLLHQCLAAEDSDGFYNIYLNH